MGALGHTGDSAAASITTSVGNMSGRIASDLLDSPDRTGRLTDYTRGGVGDFGGEHGYSSAGMRPSQVAPHNTLLEHQTTLLVPP